MPTTIQNGDLQLGQIIYGSPNDDFGSEQLVQYDVIKKAIKDSKRMKEVVGKLASSQHVQSNRGKVLKGYRYLPILDDANLGNHGLDAQGNAITNQNFYGESTDIDTILGAMPVLNQYTGRGNRTSITRVVYEATITENGFYTELTRDAEDFDSDKALLQHITTECLMTATEMNETKIRIDLITGAGIVLYGGVAGSLSDLTGETGAAVTSEPTYKGAINVGTILDDNNCSVGTSIYDGSTNSDTRVIGAARYCFVSTKLRVTMLGVKDFDGNRAMIEAPHYATTSIGGGFGLESTGVFEGEMGYLQGLRIIAVPKFPVREGEGVAVGSNGGNAGYYATNGRYDAYPMLVVGSDSFTHLKFSSKYAESGQFEINMKTPKEAGSIANPFHKLGYKSIQWWQGSLIHHPEWIAVTWVVAKK